MFKIMGLLKNIIYILKGHDVQREISILKSQQAVSEEKKSEALKDKNAVEAASRHLKDQLSTESKLKQEQLDNVKKLENLNKELSNRINELSSAKSDIEQKLINSEKLIESLKAEKDSETKIIEAEWKAKYSILEKKLQELTTGKHIPDDASKTITSSKNLSSQKNVIGDITEDTLESQKENISTKTEDKQIEESDVNSTEGSKDGSEKTQPKINFARTLKEDKNLESEVDSRKSESTTDHVISKLTTRASTDKNFLKPKIDEAIKLSNGEIVDFPDIVNDSRHNSNRTIRYVFDNNYHPIYAQQFFENSKPEAIAEASRNLSIAFQEHRLMWYCPKCHRAVKIAHWKNSLFFVHAEKNGICEWRNPSKKKQDEDSNGNSSVLDKEDNMSLDATTIRYQELKNRIYAALTTAKSQRKFDDVRMDCPMHDKRDYSKWTRADISFRFKNRFWVIELQHKGQSSSYIAEKDHFYCSNKIQTLWIFGSDNDTSYEYMNTFNYKTTLFGSHRNVFVFDKQAQEETSALGELRIKCNWLDENDEWHFQLKKDGVNGETIGLDDLVFDDINCKPFVNNYNIEGEADKCNASSVGTSVDENKDIEVKSIADNRISTNKSVKEEQNSGRSYIEGTLTQNLQTKEPQQEAKVIFFAVNGLCGFKSDNKVIIEPTFTEVPVSTPNGFFQVNKNGNIGIVDKYGNVVIDWNGVILCEAMDYDAVYGRILFRRNYKWGVADKNGNVLIEPDYNRIETWSHDIYKVKKQLLYGLCNIHNQLILKCEYSYIGKFYNGKANVERTHPFDKTRNVRGAIGYDGKPINSLENVQPDGNVAVLQIGLWGLQDKDGKTLIPCKYDSIDYIKNDVYKANVGKKWNLISLKNNVILYNNDNGSLTLVKEGKTTIVPPKRDEKEFNPNIIQLPNGWQKTKVCGKWGIVDAFGKEIILHQYDEIGDFHGRLIGIKDGNISDLSIDFDYHVIMKGNLEDMGPKGYTVKIANIPCYLRKTSCLGKTAKEIFNKDKESSQFVFQNIDWISKIYFIRLIKPEDIEKPLLYLDRDSDFAKDKPICGNVSFRLRSKRGAYKLFIDFPDGRKTIVTKKLFQESSKDINDYIEGVTIELCKKGFDAENRQTIWQIL